VHFQKEEVKLEVLIIEDNQDVADAVSLCFQLRWPEVTLSIALKGEQGIEMLESDSIDVVILDLNLPDIDGFEVLRRIRSFSDVPIIILTVRGEEEDQAIGLEIGADDYIIKPFRPRDLIARVNSVLRRTRAPEANSTAPSIVRGKLTLYLNKNEVHLADRIAKLTPTESKLLYVLMKDADHTLKTEKISQEVWGEDYTSTDPVRTYIRRLRDKLNDNPPQIILNQRGEGYRFVSPT